MHIAQRICLNMVTSILVRPALCGQQTSVLTLDAYFRSNESEFSHRPVRGCCPCRRGVMTCSRSSLRAKRRFWFGTEDPIQVPAPGIARKTAPTELVNPTSRKTSTSPGTARWWQGKCNRGRGQSLQRYESSKRTSLSGASEASLEWERKSCEPVWRQDN